MKFFPHYSIFRYEQKDVSRIKYYAPVDFPGFTQKEVMLSRAKEREKEA